MIVLQKCPGCNEKIPIAEFKEHMKKHKEGK